MLNSPRTVTTQLSDATLRRLAADSAVREVRAAGLPLRLRFHASREAGSWFAVHHAGGRSIWRKVGQWPALPAKAMLAKLPELQAGFATDRTRRDLSAGGFATLGQVLTWHLERALKDRNLSDSRKDGLTSAIRGQLLPLVGNLELSAATHAALDERVLWPLQQRYEVSTVRLAFSAMKAATHRAATLRMIEADPLAGVKFSDFIKASPQPKPGRLPASRLPVLLKQISAQPARARVLVLLMLMHGTRIGETRRARWADLDLTSAAPCWLIPAATTKTKTEHRLPLTEPAAALLKVYRATCPGAFLFPCARGGAPLSHQDAGRLIRSISGGEWSAHDLRKAARTCWMDQGTDYMVAEMLLNHALSKLDQTYIHTYAERQKRAALECHHRWLIGQGLNI